MGVRVVFEVTCPTIGSEAVCLVGSLPELGAMDPGRAVRLESVDSDCSTWRTAELTLPDGSPEAVQYKYIKIFSGSVVQWEAGPMRVLELGEMCKYEANFVEDVAYDIDDNIARRNGYGRIRFEEQAGLAKSYSRMTSLQTSAIASSITSPLRTSANPTPPEKVGCRRELDSILWELVKLESMSLPSRPEIRRAITSVRAAIEAERKGNARMRGTCAALVFMRLSLWTVPLLPLVVASFILWRVPSARRRKATAARELRAALARCLPCQAADSGGAQALACPWLRAPRAAPPPPRAAAARQLRSGAAASACALLGRRP